MRIKDSHYIILHEGQSIVIFGPSGALVRKNMLDSNDKNVGLVVFRK